MRVEIKSRAVPYQFILPSGHVLFKIEEVRQLEASCLHNPFQR